MSRPQISSAISILGASLDVGNRGVLALGVALANLCAQVRPESAVVFHYTHTEGGIRRLGDNPAVEVLVRNCRLSPRSARAEHIVVILLLAVLYRLGIRGPARRNSWLKSLLDAEFIGDIRGGDSFSDIYGFGRFLSGSLPLLSVALLGRPYTLLPQTYGPFRLRASRWLAARLLCGAAAVWTRDRNCEQMVMRLTGTPARFCPDVAFTLQAMKPQRLQFMPSNFDFDRQNLVVGVNVSGLLYMGGYTGRNMFGLRSEYRELMHQLIDSLLRATDARVLLVPHSFGSEFEEEACAALVQSTGGRHVGRVFMLRTPLSEREVKWVIGRTGFFVGSRMHACIAALSQCVPTVGLAYSDKFLGVFESANVGDSVIDLRRCEMSAIVEHVILAFQRRDDSARQLQASMRITQEKIVGVFRELLTPMTSPPENVGS